MSASPRPRSRQAPARRRCIRAVAARLRAQRAGAAGQAPVDPRESGAAVKAPMPAARRRPMPRRARRRARNERLGPLHPAADRDIPAWPRRPARRPARLQPAAGLFAAAGRLPNHPGDDAASRRQSRHARVAGDGAARTSARSNSVADDDDFVERLRPEPDHAAIRSRRATSTPPRRTCKRRSTLPPRPYRATCPTRPSIRR